MNFILSKYTHCFKTSNDEPLVYNSENNCFLKVSKSLFNDLIALSQGKDFPIFEKETLNLLLKYNIIIEKDKKYSFFNKMKLLNCLDRFNYDKLTLNIIPTSCCNFYCPYCFEKNKTNHTMTDKVIDDLFSFINKNEKAKKINLMWYGGEPLLAFEKIKTILNRLHNEVSIPINNHSMITNGYLFNKEVCNFFKEYPLNDIQITLDGDAETHNAKRFTRTDHSTFNKIIENIDNIFNELPDIHVYIRINIDESNKSSFHNLHNTLLSRWHDKRISIYPGFIRIENEEQTEMIEPSILGDSKRSFFFDLENKGTEVNFYPMHREKSCSAVRMNTYIIGPEGEFYKCWNDVSDKSKIIGYINQSQLTNPDLLAKYVMDGTLFEDAECKDCFFFPICGGGCPQYRLKNKYENGKYNLCPVQNDQKMDKQYLSQCLEKHYNKIKGSKQIIEF